MTLRHVCSSGAAVALALAVAVIPAAPHSGAAADAAPVSPIKHVIVIVQENRTPDSLFFGLCIHTHRCPPPPPLVSQLAPASLYDIRTGSWLERGKPGGSVSPGPMRLATTYDLNHGHSGFVAQCDGPPGLCKMDGADPRAYDYVQPSDVEPYLFLARNFGWANRMFQSNQGPSFPAHQFLFGATSAPSAADDAAGIFAAENMAKTGVGGLQAIAGCAALRKTKVLLIKPSGREDTYVRPCFEHQTLVDVLPSSATWRYYTPTPGIIWSAPNAIAHLCGVPSVTTVGQKCSGPAWTTHMDFHPADVLTDIASCNLRSVSWVIPTALRSDHANVTDGSGPSWVASIVNAVGNATACDGAGYWNDTAIVLTWDDWGGWYDHVAPPAMAMPQGDYQFGFRVPLIVISAYTPRGYINNATLDFGSIVRFIERTFGVSQGALTFDDARVTTDLYAFFAFDKPARTFTPIPAPKSAAFFLHDTRPVDGPDDD